VPQYEEAPTGMGTLWGRNVTLTGGPGAQRPYIEELLPDVLEGRIEPGRVFDRTVDLAGVPDGYRAMDARAALKVLVRP
jgi:threonine dehydrogenase-like Zn-dependent dehydrogenase